MRWETHKHNCLNSGLKKRMRNRATGLARWEICTVIVLKVTVFSLQRLCGEGTALYWLCSFARGCVCYWLNHPEPKGRDLLQSLSDLVFGRWCQVSVTTSKGDFGKIVQGKIHYLLFRHILQSYPDHLVFYTTISWLKVLSSCPQRWRAQKTVRISGKSLVNVHNSNGPKSNPWDTPLVTCRVLELQLSIFRSFLRFSR